jgi:hypothetical protein
MGGIKKLFGGGDKPKPPPPPPPPPQIIADEIKRDMARKRRGKGRASTFITGELAPLPLGAKRFLA